jgi:hypothetical protein
MRQGSNRFIRRVSKKGDFSKAMPPDPRWLEILKASGWQTAAVASASGFFLLAVRWGWIPPLEPWMVQLSWIALLLSGFLAIGSLLSAASTLFPIKAWVAHSVRIHRAKRDLRNYIPFMTEKERQIIAYLLAKNQKTFTAEMDGGYAATLLSRGIVRITAQHGQQLDFSHVPMSIPDPLWSVLLQFKDSFPYIPPKKTDGVAPHPWRTPWGI